MGLVQYSCAYAVCFVALRCVYRPTSAARSCHSISFLSIPSSPFCLTEAGLWALPTRSL